MFMASFMNGIHEILSLCFPKSGYSKICNEDMDQFPELPKEIYDIIFSSMKLSELSILSQSCKQWNRNTHPYLKVLKKEAIHLSKVIDNIFIREKLLFLNQVTVDIPCQISGDSITICKKSSYAPECFIISALFKVHFGDDGACTKSLEAFFCFGRCDGYLSNELLEIKSVEFHQGLHSEKRKHILRIMTAVNKIIRFQRSEC